jgi:hypothetical protein
LPGFGGLPRWNVAQPATAGGALVLTPAQPAPYDGLLVWFDRGRVVCIVARHTASTPAPTQPPQLAAAVREAWARDLRSLGWPRREDVTSEDVLEGMGWHDEWTRVRVFWQDPDQGAPRLYTEWKGLP